MKTYLAIVPIALRLAIFTVCGSAHAQSAVPKMTLTTRFDDQVHGTWQELDRSDLFRWQMDGFANPFFLRGDDVRSIRVQSDLHVAPDPCPWLVYLTDGSLVRGVLKSISEDNVHLELPDGQLIVLHRWAVHAVARSSETDPPLDLLSHGLDQWTVLSGDWRDAGGKFVSDKPNSSLELGVVFPRRYDATVELSWQSQPDFSLRLATGSDNTLGIRLETVRNTLAVIVESEDKGDILPLTKLENQPGKLQLRFLADTTTGKLLVCSSTNAVLGELFLPARRSGGVGIHDYASNLQIDSLRVRSWDGRAPLSIGDDQVGVVTVTGEFLSGHVITLDSLSDELMFSESVREPLSTKEQDNALAAKESRSLSLSEIDRVVLGNPAVEPNEEWRLVTHSGSRIAVQYLRFLGGRIWVSNPALVAAVGIDVVDIQRLVRQGLQPEPSTNSEIAKAASSAKEWQQLLTQDGTRLRGRLVPTKLPGTSTVLSWHPEAALAAESFSPSISGRIDFHQKPTAPKTKIAKKPTRSVSQFVRGLAMVFGKQPPRQPAIASEPTPQSTGPAIYLCSGECVRGTLVAMDNEGVEVALENADTRRIENDRVRTIVLSDNYRAAQITAAKRDRLLTVPRIQQDRPPTHLLVSTNGDLFRTRILKIDKEFVHAEVRLTTRRIPRANVAVISWLTNAQDDEETDDNGIARVPDEQLHVRAMWSDDRRLSFTPTKLDNSILFGSNLILGTCRVELRELHHLLLGTALGSDPSSSDTRLALRRAVEPAYRNEDGTTDRLPGQESALVGKPAPPLKLKMVDGETFDLREQRGKVVVLDFWASWCGPCIQWLPQLEELVQQYEPGDIQLVTVNLSEDAETIQRMLDRLKIAPRVAMDIDGVAAASYEATAIPQTVVINRKGEIARLYIGSPNRIAEHLKEALDMLIE